jgi:hypothetical protein
MIGYTSGFRKVIHAVRMFFHLLLEESPYGPHKGLGFHNGLQTKPHCGSQYACRPAQNPKSA